jgi:hypothetical protein
MVQMSVEQCWLQDKTPKSYSSGSTTSTANRAEDEDGEEERRLQQQISPHRPSFHHHSANNSKNNVMGMNNNSKSVEMGMQQQKQTSDNNIGGVVNNVNDSLLSDHNDHKQQQQEDDDIEEETATTSKKRPDDPVGDIITNMLNEGSIPYFGYQNYCQQQHHQHNQQQRQQMMQGGKDTIFTEEEEDKFDWNHILCMRNFRAMRKFIVDSASWMMTTSTTTDNTTNNGHRYHRQHNDEGTSSSPSSIIMMRFLQEVFLVQLVMVYSVSDIVLRSTMWFVMLTIMLLVHTLVDIDEIYHGLVTLIGSKRVSKLINATDQFRNYWEQMMKTIHTDFLWGDYLQGRTIVWSEEDRLPKFRRKHMTLIRIIKERRENAKSIRRIERESKRSKRKGLIESAAEAVIVDEAKILLLARKGELDAAARELNQKPPTYFPTTVTLENNNNNKDDEEKEEEEETSASNIHHQRSDATNGHLEALRFCHRMVFLRDQEAQQQQKYNVHEAKQQLRIEQENDKMLVSIASAGSADNNIEVVSKEINISPSDRASVDDNDNDESTACSDFPSVGVHYDSDSDGDSVSYASSVSSSSQALPWLAVGAKIGEKLLKSRKLQRVVANPDEIQKTIPNEALKLIDDMDIPDEVKENATEMLVTRSPSVSKRLEQQREEKRREKEAQQKQDAMKLKHPVHGMWTSPSPVTTTPGKVTRVMSPPRNDKTPPNSKFPVIEMPTSFNDPSFSSPVPAERPNQAVSLFKSTPPIDRQPKKINRLAPIEKGVRIVVPLFSPDPNNSITMNASSFHQMVRHFSSCFSNSCFHEELHLLIGFLHYFSFLLGNCHFISTCLRPIK